MYNAQARFSQEIRITCTVCPPSLLVIRCSEITHTIRALPSSPVIKPRVIKPACASKNSQCRSIWKIQSIWSEIRLFSRLLWTLQFGLLLGTSTGAATLLLGTCLCLRSLGLRSLSSVLLSFVCAKSFCVNRIVTIILCVYIATLRWTGVRWGVGWGRLVRRLIVLIRKDGS